jgi:hypothetical protein
MSSPPVYKPVVHLDELGEQGRLPAGGIINAGGVEGPGFTIGGQAVILADGTASDGSGPVIVVGTNKVIGFEWIQATPKGIWSIPHMKGTKRLQVTIWDSTDEMIFSDMVKIVDANNVIISFNTPLSGRAILMLF